MNWIQALRANSQAWENFQEWMKQRAYRELKALAEVNRDGHDYQRGKVAGWKEALAEAVAGEKEEKAKHEYRRRNRDA